MNDMSKVAICVFLIILFVIQTMAIRASNARVEEYRYQMEKGIALTEGCLEELTEAQRGYE